MIITIQITEEDAVKFAKFQQHYELFDILNRSGILDIKYGKGVLNFAGGVLQNCVKEEIMWKR